MIAVHALKNMCTSEQGAFVMVRRHALWLATLFGCTSKYFVLFDVHFIVSSIRSRLYGFAMQSCVLATPWDGTP